MYDVRRIVMIVIGLVLAFLLFLVVSFYVYPAINPEAKMSFNDGEVYLYDYASFGPKSLREMKDKIDALERELSQRKSKEIKDIALIDSLFQATMQMEDELLTLKSAAPQSSNGLADIGVDDSGNFEQDPKVKEIAKSLMRLDEEELRMILSPLSDKQIIQLYATSSNSQREKLLRSLEPLKAASILKRLMS